MQTIEVIAEHDKWRELSKSVREKLVAERDELTTRLEEVNRRLAEMNQPEIARDSEDAVASIKSPSILERIQPGDSMSEIVRKILKAANKPLRAAEIIEYVEKVRTVERRATIHSILFQLKNKELVEAQERAGKLEFSWKGEPE